MRRLVPILATAAAIVWLAAPPLSASVRPLHQHGAVRLDCNTSLKTGFLQDGNGAGDAASLQPFANPGVAQQLFAIPVNGGAWRWDMLCIATLGIDAFPGDPGLSNAVQGDDVYSFQLHANTSMCMANDAGAANLEPCGSPFHRLWWIYNPPTGYWINWGRSEDENNWEILCNPGGGNALTITTRDNCSDYHEEWYFNTG